MHANDLFRYRDKIIQAFKEGTFSSEHLKKSDGAAHDYVLENVNDFIQKIKSMSENINLSLFNEFFELSPAGYAKELIKVKDPDENKEIVAEIKDRLSDLKDRIKEMSETENADETLKIIEEIHDYNKNAQKIFRLHQELIKENQNQNLKKKSSIKKMKGC